WTPTYLFPQCGAGVGFRGPDGGDVSGGEEDGDESRGGGGDAEGVVRGDAVELGAHGLHEDDGDRSGGGESRAGEHGSLAHHHAEDAFVVRSEGDADTDFARAAGHGEAYESVDADGGEERREGRENSGEGGDEPLRSEGGGDLGLDGLHSGEGQGRV